MRCFALKRAFEEAAALTGVAGRAGRGDDRQQRVAITVESQSK